MCMCICIYVYIYVYIYICIYIYIYILHTDRDLELIYSININHWTINSNPGNPHLVTTPMAWYFRQAALHLDARLQVHGWTRQLCGCQGSLGRLAENQQIWIAETERFDHPISPILLGSMKLCYGCDKMVFMILPNIYFYRISYVTSIQTPCEHASCWILVESLILLSNCCRLVLVIQQVVTMHVDGHHKEMSPLRLILLLQVLAPGLGRWATESHDDPWDCLPRIWGWRSKKHRLKVPIRSWTWWNMCFFSVSRSTVSIYQYQPISTI